MHLPRPPPPAKLCCYRNSIDSMDNAELEVKYTRNQQRPRSSISSNSSSQSARIPPSLSFDKIVTGDTCYPCRCRDFMSYLAFVEFNAENLKFYLWAKDYTRRFNMNLFEAERALSPPWSKEIVTRSKGVDFHITENNTRSEKAPERASVCEIEIGLDDDMTASVQPFRAEITAITHLFLLPSSSLELNLSDRDRAATLHALRYTTHPSALAPALNAAEHALRHQSHPTFIRRITQRNSNPQRSLSLHLIGYVMALASVVLAVLLVLSPYHRAWRALPAILAGVAVGHIISGRWDFCTRLFLSGFRRNLEPWESFSDFLEVSMDSSIHNINNAGRSGSPIDPDRGFIMYGFAIDEEKGMGSMASLDFDGFDEKACEENIARFEQRSKFERAFENGVRIVDPTVRKNHIRMAVWIYGLSLATIILGCVALIPLPRYGLL